jgi:hypothetical protein
MAKGSNAYSTILDSLREKAASVQNERQAVIDGLHKVISDAQAVLSQLGDSPTVSRKIVRGRRLKRVRRGRRTVTAAQREAQSRKMKAYWKKRKAGKRTKTAQLGS